MNPRMVARCPGSLEVFLGSSDGPAEMLEPSCPGWGPSEDPAPAVQPHRNPDRNPKFHEVQDGCSGVRGKASRRHSLARALSTRTVWASPFPPRLA